MHHATTKDDIKLLYITRKFPPMVGGMEKVSYALAKEFSKKVDTTLITWSRSQKYLPFVYVLFLIKSLYLVPARKITHVHIGDPILSPLGLLLKALFRVKTTITVHGLDITWDFPGYQVLVPRCVARMDKVMCISEATRKECIKRGIPAEKCVVIPCGVYAEDWIVKATRKDLEKIVGKNLEGKKVIITVGRLVKRKGVYWFIENVLPKLDRNTIYLVIGEGPERSRIEELIRKLDFGKRVMLLGKISDHDLKIIYNTADLFVMPNIKDSNNIEGFGIVALEASSAGLPVIASNTEGIKTAVKNSENGYLLKLEDKENWITKVNVILNGNKFQKKQIISWVTSQYNWEEITRKYMNEIEIPTSQ